MHGVTRILTAEGDGLASIRQELLYSGAELEREARVPRGSVSAVERGRLYAYPRFRAAVTTFLARETGEPFDDLHSRLFPGYELVEPPSEAGSE